MKHVLSVVLLALTPTIYLCLMFIVPVALMLLWCFSTCKPLNEWLDFYMEE